MRMLLTHSAALGLLWLVGRPAAPETPVRIFAAASLTDALSAAGRVLTADPTAPRLVFQFAASNDLARQIKAGAPADLFFSADALQMDALQSEGLLEESTRRDVLSNQLVVVAPRASPLSLRGPQDLTRPEIRRLALADPAAVPAGVYARRYLVKQGLWVALEPRVVPTLDVRAALAAVGSGNVDLGFVYRTDAALSDRARIVYEVPPAEAPSIVYPVAAISGRFTSQVAAVLRFLVSEPARQIYSQHGFIVLPPSSQP